jgi:hypothetical protein
VTELDRPGPNAADLVERVMPAIERLAEIGETIEDEWQYVNDLRTVYAGRLAAVARELGPAALAPEIETGIEEAIAETRLIVDPHRAIDWLSTLPQVVLLALGADA